MKWFVTIPFVLLMGACASNNDPVTARPITIDSQPIDRPDLVLPPVDRYNARDLEWIIVTPDNAEQVFSRLDREGRDGALFALTAQGYENLSINIREALRIIRQQQAVIEGYKEYYILVNSRITEHNANQ